MVKDRRDNHPGVETLSQCVKRILEEKHFTMTDVEQRSERRIADAYVANIVKGLASNPSTLSRHPRMETREQSGKPVELPVFFLLSKFYGEGVRCS